MVLPADYRQRDAEWSRDVRERDDRTCRRCGRRGYVEAAHIFPRDILATRWDRDNGLTLCAGPIGEQTCHEWFDSATRNPERWEWAAAQIGQEVFDALALRANQVQKRVPRQGVALPSASVLVAAWDQVVAARQAETVDDGGSQDLPLHWLSLDAVLALPGVDGWDAFNRLKADLRLAGLEDLAANLHLRLTRQLGLDERPMSRRRDEGDR